MKPLLSWASFQDLLSGFADGSLKPEWRLLVAHDLLREKADLPWRDRFYRRWRALLATLRLAPPYVSRYDWLPALKHVPLSGAREVLVIWGVGVEDRDVQRASCLELRDALAAHGEGWLPVLLTDCADFAFFSRLGWQVEYLPLLGGDGEDYFVRKCRYLAWRYRGARGLVLGEGVAERLVELGAEDRLRGDRRPI